MVVAEERAMVGSSGPPAGALRLAGRHADEWRFLTDQERALLTPEVLERWTRDLADDDYTLEEVVGLERRRLDNLRTMRQGIELTDLEFKLFRYLARANGRVRTYIQIANHLWGSTERPIRGSQLKSEDGYASPYIRHIWVLIAEIRRKTEIDPSRPQHLALRRGVGYSWHADPPSLDDGVDYGKLADEVEGLRVQVRYELGGDIGAMPIPRGGLHPQLGPSHPAYEEALEGEVTRARSEPHTDS